MDKQLLVMMLSSGTFPTGAFSQSRGLETYVENKIVNNAEGLKGFMDAYLKHVLCCLEGPYLVAAYECVKGLSSTDAGDEVVDLIALDKKTIDTIDELSLNNENQNTVPLDNKAIGLISTDNRIADLTELNSELVAMKTTKESREGICKSGNAFMRVASGITDDRFISEFYEKFKNSGIAYPIAYGLVCSRLDIDLKSSLRGFFFSELNGIVQSGLKLIPLGNIESQKVLFDSIGDIEEAVNKTQGKTLDDINTFNPGFDIASMNHEYLKTRLYIS